MTPTLRWIYRSWLLILLCLIPARVEAGAEPISDCGEACRAAFEAFAPVYFESRSPALAANAETFEAAINADGRSCPVRRQPGPAVYGVMLAPAYGGSGLPLDGPLNDARLMAQVMRDRGVAVDFIVTSQGADATRAGMLNAMAEFLPCLRERDQIVLFFTGWASVWPHEWFSKSNYFQAFCAWNGHSQVRAICDAAAAGNADENYLGNLADAIDTTAYGWLSRVQPASHYLPGGRQHVLMSDDSAWEDYDGAQILSRLDGVTATEVSNFVTRTRNRGADAFLIIDTRLAGSGDLVALQQQAGAPVAWAADGDVIISNDGFPPNQNNHEAQGLVPLFGTGHFAVVYGSDQNSNAFEYRQGAGRTQLGGLTFRVSELLRQESTIRFADMARTIARSFEERNQKVSESGRQEPMFMASNLDLTLLAPRAEVVPRKAGDIEIISPAPKRGFQQVEEPSLTVVARYNGPAKAVMAIIDGELVTVDANGQFRRELNDLSGRYSIALRVLGANYETLAASDLKLRDKPEEPVVSSPARKVALIIANQDYADPAFPSLATPIADAQAVAGLLTGRFGFTTTIEGDGGPLDLFLRNATKARIQQTLFEVRRRLAAEDQLLIYYAGHGENDPDLGAYWVPVDGEANHDYSWYAAEDITRELKRMNAQSVLVISDSCYAGGLARSGTEEKPSGEARNRYLAKASRLKSRQLMASGGEEPVVDGGGDGHSVFARALIEALKAMPEPTFTANELFELKVKPAVIASSNALAEGQIPGFHRISRAGDEPSSEFIFQSATQQ